MARIVRVSVCVVKQVIEFGNKNQDTSSCVVGSAVWYQGMDYFKVNAGKTADSRDVVLRRTLRISWIKKSTHNAEVMSTAAVVHELMEMIYKCHCQLEVFCHAMRNNGLQKLFNTARKIHYKEKRKTATNNEIFGQSWYMSAESLGTCQLKKHHSVGADKGDHRQLCRSMTANIVDNMGP